ncbi:MAG: translation elongation factor-like protein [Nanoarchaeota archaeon]|nr:translation elongation factor-like protein [Nanoarchaeota archaeon]
MAEKVEIGKISHFFDKISVCVIELTADLKVGDKISIEGHDNVLEQEVTSMEIDRKPVESAGSGESIGMKTDKPVKRGDIVFKIVG